MLELHHRVRRQQIFRPYLPRKAFEKYWQRAKIEVEMSATHEFVAGRLAVANSSIRREQWPVALTQASPDNGFGERTVRINLPATACMA